MCSTPKPNRRVNTKKANHSGGILSSMSSEKRQAFTERANQASARRIKVEQLRNEKQHQLKKSTTKGSGRKNMKAKTHTKQSWLYWLLHASMGDLMRRLIH